MPDAPDQKRQGPQPSGPAHAAQRGEKTPEQVKDPNSVTLTIDGHEVTVPKGTLVVEAAKRLKIEIPVFCYHHKLTPVGACRLCLVELSPGPPRPTTACTTPVAEGMVVKTMSAMAVESRADILEFELVNHPLDCPVCDKGGECPLQDYTFRHGYPTSRIDGPRLHFQKPVPLSDLIALDRERCVLCYRCTRYYDEVAWEQELTAEERGVRTVITSQFDRPLESIFSGNIIDLCPVGALTSRVWRFESRSWDMDSKPSVCSKCSVGCNVNYWQRRGQLVRVTSRENDEIDDGWICDRGRFDYTHVNSPQRLRTPQVGGADAAWEEALAAVAGGLKGRKVGISIPQDITNEEIHLLKRLVDGPLRGARLAMQNRTLLPAPAGATLKIADLDRARAIVVIASDTAEDVPIVNLRIKKAVSKHGAKLVLVNDADLDLDRWHGPVDHVRPGAGGTAAALKALAGHEFLKEGPTPGSPGSGDASWGGIAILLGDGRGSEDVEALGAAVSELASAVSGSVLPLYRGTNERGLLAAGLSVERDLEGCDAVLCWGAPAGGAIPSSAKFVAVWDSELRPEHGRPDVLLPAATFAETQGSYTNLEGRVQFLVPVLEVKQPLREGWAVLSELLTLLGTPADYLGIYQLQREAAAAIEAFAPLADPPAPGRPATTTLHGAARP